MADTVPLIVTIAVPLEGNVGIHTRAEGVSEAEVRPLIDRAIAALQAERAALETCPYHTRGGDQP